MADKHSADQIGPGEDEQAQKRPRLEGAGPVPPSSASTLMARKPAVSLDALEKAKKALQLQKALKEKLKNLPQFQKPGAAPGEPATAAPLAIPSLAPPAAAPPSQLPPPPAAAAAAAEAGPSGRQPSPPPPAAFEAKGYDPELEAAMRKQRRPRATFDFVPEGRFQKEAEVARLQARYGEQRGPGGRRFGGPGAGGQPAWLQASAGGDANQVPLGPKMALAAEAAALPAQAVEQVVELEEVPEVEWWDRRLLEHESYAAALLPDGGVALKAGRVTHLVEHPVPLEPPRPEVAPPPQPLKLTSRELKKLRTQRRVAREKEKQELLRQGLLEAPAPRVKISNLHRVLGMEAAADPTAIEQEVRRQMAERLAAHEDRNLARKLTPAEAREKKLRKMFDQAPAGLEGAGAGPELYCAVYRIASLANPQHAYKVDVNAKENHMSGVVLVTDDFTLVVAEGVSKALKRYNKLMLRRIDWTQAKPAGAGVEEDAPGEDEDNEGVDPLARPNSCDLVWQGTVLGAAFPDFRVYKLGNPSAAKALLQQAGVGHYWDAAASFIPGGPAMEAML